MYPVYNQCARNLVSLLDKHSQTQEPIELQELFKRFTLDTFSSIGFGYPMSSLLHPVPFSQTFDWLLEEVNARWRFPWRKLTLQWLWKAKLEELDLFVLSLIEERRKMGWQGKADFLSKLLELEANKEIDEVTPNFLRDQVVNFLLAGRDTTAILLAATIYYLSFHPDVEAKVRREVEEVVGEEEVGMRHTGRLKYLGNVLDEVLRVFPPAVPFNHRYVTKDVVLPNGACLPKGVMVMYSPYTLHRLKEYWGEDAEEFKPERWEKEDLFKHPYQYVPFQKGPRICLGMKMAIEEAKTCISIIYQHGFKFSLVSPPPDKINFLANAILSANNGIFVNVHKTTL
uniref:Cytochrome P450 n=1 Tax=Arcella intermedia TaxID=1963864 RepID=A0A6B2L9E9_9EUKA